MNDYGTTSFPMLWDGSFESWAALGIRGQPAGMLLSPDGRIVDSWSGPIPEGRVEELIAAL